MRKSGLVEGRDPVGKEGKGFYNTAWPCKGDTVELDRADQSTLDHVLSLCDIL